jgi:hypothetical protein
MEVQLSQEERMNKIQFHKDRLTLKPVVVFQL